MNIQSRTRNVVLGVLCVMVMLIVALFSATRADPPRTVTHVPPLSAPPDANIVYLYRHATDLHTDLIAPENIARSARQWLAVGMRC